MMEVLITGGYGFIGSHVAERFFKEGYKVIIIDNLTSGKKSNLTVEHTAYTFSAEHANCAEVFRVHNIDIVVHLAYTETAYSTRGYNQPASMLNMAGLINILDLSRQYRIKKIIFPSDIQVYGAQPGILSEATPLNPDSYAGISKLTAETYCLNLQKRYNLPVLILRLSNVYGPRQVKGAVWECLQEFSNKDKSSKSSGLNPVADKPADYVYVNDVVEAVYKAATLNIPSQIMNVASGRLDSLSKLRTLLSEFSQKTSEHGQIALTGFSDKYTGVSQKIAESDERMSLGQSRIDNSLCCASLPWAPKYTFREGAKHTYEWFVNRAPEPVADTANSIGRGRSFAVVLPYIENILLFLLVASLTLLSQDKSTINTDIGIDYSFVYIIVMGLLYGKIQSIPATILSMGLFFYTQILAGADLVELLYQPQSLFHLAMYLLAGVLSGYISDKQEMLMQNMQTTLDNLSTRYKFLENRYLETIEIKEKLYKQLINSSDSIGRMYTIVKRLDSIEPEHIYNTSIQIIAELIEVPEVVLYTVDEQGQYLHQKAKTAKASPGLPQVLELTRLEYLQVLVRDQNVFVNKQLEQGLPDMAAPIVCNGKVVAVLQIHNIAFEKLDLQHETLFKVMAKLISDALNRVYIYEHKSKDKHVSSGDKNCCD